MDNVEIEIILADWKSDIEDYMSGLKDVLQELGKAAESCNTDDTAAWYKKSLRYNVPGSRRQAYGVIAVVTYKSLVQKHQLTAENLKLARYLGYCVDLLHSTIYVSDDVLDQSATRRGQTCWYKLKESKLTTPTDVIMIENGIYELLRKHFRHLDCYADIVELFHELMFQSAKGQLMDYLLSKKNVSTFNMETYNIMNTNKAGSHMLYLPVILALYLAGVKDPQAFQQCKQILVPMGDFGQVQNDFLDCFVDPGITGRIGTDIEDNKCSWLAITCMQRANPEQKAIMMECYGQNDPQKVARVRQLYKEMNIAKIYLEYEKETYKKFKMLIDQASDVLPKEVMLNILSFTVKDNKINKL